MLMAFPEPKALGQTLNTQLSFSEPGDQVTVPLDLSLISNSMVTNPYKCNSKLSNGPNLTWLQPKYLTKS